MGRTILRWLLLWLLLSGLSLAFLLLCAGRGDWFAAYGCLLIVLPGTLAQAAWLQQYNLPLFERRARVGYGTPRWDTRLVSLSKLCVLTIFLLAGLQARFEGPEPMRAACWLPALVLFVAGVFLLGQSMASNAFFESYVRHQVEHCHRVVDEGPYRFVRHPGYLAYLLMFGSVPLFLGSTWASAGWVALALTLIVRIGLEERFLGAALSSYQEYRRKVRYRLLPGVW